MMFANVRKFSFKAAVAISATALVLGQALAQTPKYGPGSTASEIKIGQTMPYSGPASAYGTTGRLQRAYFKKINDEGGINGRLIQFISLDDGYSPSKTVEHIRRLVEQDEVLLLFQPLGTPTNSAVHKYVNGKKVPHLFLASGANKWNDPKNFPWTMGFNLNYQAEGEIYARYLLKNRPNAKIAILYQNDDYGKDLLAGVKKGLVGRNAAMIVAEATYEITDPTIDSQIVTLSASGADTFINLSTPKFAAQAIRKVFDLGWKPLHILSNVSASVGSVLVPAGLDKSKGIVTVQYYKDINDPRWADDAAILEYRGFMGRHYAEGDPADGSNTFGYIAAQAMVQVLRQCGNDLTRENVMRQAANLKNFKPGLLLPGISMNTGPGDHGPIEQGQLSQFDGKRWELFGDVIGPTS